MVLGPDAGVHEDVRGVDGAGGQDDLLPGADDPPAAAPHQLHRRGSHASLVEQHPGGPGLRQDVQVFAAPVSQFYNDIKQENNLNVF